MVDEFKHIEIDKKLHTETITPELLDYIIKKIVDAIQPEKIILFGSFARGDYNKNSDIDLFIIKDGISSNETLRRKIDALLRGRLFSIDLFVRKPIEVEMNIKAKNPFYLYHIFKNSKVLYEKS